jgi:hypothetical protein
LPDFLPPICRDQTVWLSKPQPSKFERREGTHGLTEQDGNVTLNNPHSRYTSSPSHFIPLSIWATPNAVPSSTKMVLGTMGDRRR